jgi:hypothetical protein
MCVCVCVCVCVRVWILRPSDGLAGGVASREVYGPLSNFYNMFVYIHRRSHEEASRSVPPRPGPRPTPRRRRRRSPARWTATGSTAALLTWTPRSRAYGRPPPPPQHTHTTPPPPRRHGRAYGHVRPYTRTCTHSTPPPRTASNPAASCRVTPEPQPPEVPHHHALQRRETDFLSIPRACSLLLPSSEPYTHNRKILAVASEGEHLRAAERCRLAIRVWAAT